MTPTEPRWSADWFRVTEDQLRSLEPSTPALDEPWGPESNVVLAGPFFVERNDRPSTAIGLTVYPHEKAIEYYDGWGVMSDVRDSVTFENGKIVFITAAGIKVSIRKVTDADAKRIGGSTVADIITFYGPDEDPEDMEDD